MRLDRARRIISVITGALLIHPVLLGLVALASTLALLAWDADPRLFAARAHGWVEAFSLAMIAVAYLMYQLARRISRVELAKSILLAAAFFFWAANQVVGNPRAATACNDVAIALFVLDVFLVMAGVGSTVKESFAEAHATQQER